MAKVVFNNVTKRFNAEAVALRQFTLSIEDGEFMVLVGPSGCGKSTALRLLAGLEDITEGEILLDDQIVNQVSPQQRNIAMVFQNYALYPHMSVYANLAFPLKMRRTPASVVAEKVEQIARLLDLSQLLARKPKQLSGGQRQRVAMGRALVRDPSVFLLDEPLSNLDAKLRAQIRADIACLQKRLRKTTLYVTHDQVEAMTLGDSVAIMNNGELQQVGTPEMLYKKPQNIFVAQFIGNPGMNIIPSTVIRDNNGNIAIDIKQQTIALPASRLENLQRLDQIFFAGIRPEAFNPAHAVQLAAIKVSIQSVEFLGHESLVYFQLTNTAKHDSNNPLVARFTGQFDSSHKQEAFYVDPKAIYLFDKAGLVI
ncbi:MAG: glycerol-3-phosphate ABC transporter ATP-binding protein [Nitrosomonas sp.]|nr:MAG: glycerol-3-phosphate ABC transporter ATP-binding protein [Nitrosomonas sp.]